MRRTTIPTGARCGPVARAAALLALGTAGCGPDHVGAPGAPADAPPENPATRAVEGGLVRHAPGAFEGYTLFAPYLATTTFLVDMQGEVVHRWESEHLPAGSAYLLEDGSLLRAADTQNPRFRTHGTGGRLQRISWDGELLWDFLISDERRMQNHDVEPLPNGNVLVCVWEHRSRQEALAAGLDPARASERGFWPAALLEVEPLPPDGGRVVWEWSAWDHLIQDRDPALDFYGDVAAHPERLDLNAGPSLEPPDDEARARSAEREQAMRGIGYLGDDDEALEDAALADDGGDRDAGMGADWMHVNSVAYEPALDLVVLSSYSLNEVLVIDHSTTTAEAAGHAGGRYGRGGDVLYRWGNPQNHRAGSPADRQLFNQHDARWLPGPRLLVFNNGFGREPVPHSTVDELELPFDLQVGFLREPGRPFGPAAPAWSYRAEDPADFYGSFISGAHRLPNGNTFVCEGPHGRLFEVTRDGRVVWEYVVPFAGITVSEWWRRFGWEDDLGVGEGAAEADVEALEDDDLDDDGFGDDLMSPQAVFRATRLAPDHPGLRRLRR